MGESMRELIRSLNFRSVWLWIGILGVIAILGIGVFASYPGRAIN